MKSVLITAQKNAFDKHLVSVFAREGYEVFVSGVNEPTKKIDIYIDVSNKRDKADTFSIRSGIDEKVIRRVYNANVIKPMKLLEKYLPFLDKSKDKRLCFLSGIDASINETRDKTGYAYKTSKAAMHNLFMIAWNTLEADGYTFRVYDPLSDEVSAKAAAEGAFTYFTLRRGTENDDPLRNDENRLVMRDALGREHCW
ncbi:MAG: hypothetical protein FWD44_00790 [Oscillospiraceae bacterium]|nr:hypothetical protein [Oscillospiraceae bacterium]